MSVIRVPKEMQFYRPELGGRPGFCLILLSQLLGSKGVSGYLYVIYENYSWSHEALFLVIEPGSLATSIGIPGTTRGGQRPTDMRQMITTVPEEWQTRAVTPLCSSPKPSVFATLLRTCTAMKPYVFSFGKTACGENRRVVNKTGRWQICCNIMITVLQRYNQ